MSKIRIRLFSIKSRIWNAKETILHMKETILRVFKELETSIHNLPKVFLAPAILTANRAKMKMKIHRINSKGRISQVNNKF